MGITMSSGSSTKCRVIAVPEAGTLAIGGNDVLRVEIEGESYRIEPEDVRSLLFYGRVVPVIRVQRKTSPEGKEEQPVISIEGHAAINRTGKAVIIYTRAGHFIVPLVSFQQVARGEAVSAPLFPLVPDGQGGGPG